MSEMTLPPDWQAAQHVEPVETAWWEAAAADKREDVVRKRGERERGEIKPGLSSLEYGLNRAAAAHFGLELIPDCREVLNLLSISLSPLLLLPATLPLTRLAPSLLRDHVFPPITCSPSSEPV